MQHSAYGIRRTHGAAVRQDGQLGRRAGEAPLPRVRANIRPPLVPTDLLSRPELVARLERGLQGPLTVVSAPAGYGKTTLLSAWAAEQSRPVAWLTLDQHQDLGEFVRAVVEAIHGTAPVALRGTLGLLRTPRPADPLRLAWKLADELSALPAGFVLVLDDYHAVSTPDIHVLLSALLRRLPPGVHLLMASRNELPAAIAVLRARGAIAELGAAHLRFTPEEASVFLAGALHMHADDEIVARVASRAEGWPAGLRLAAIVAAEEIDRSVGAEAFLHGRHPYVRDFFIDDVLAGQPPYIQDLLLRTSILERFCAPQIEALLDDPEDGTRGEAVLHALTSSNLFIMQLDREGTWFRYHQLFREALQVKLVAQRGAEAVAELHRRAAAWAEAAGLLDEAIRHRLAAGDPDGAAAMIEENIHPALNREDWTSLETWLALLPVDVATRRAALLVARAWTLHFRSRYADISPLLRRAERLAGNESAPGQRRLHAEIDALEGIVHAFYGSQLDALSAASRALDNLPGDWTFARGFAWTVLSTSLQRLGRGDEALARLTTEVNDSDGEDPILLCHVLSSLTRLHFAATDLRNAERYAAHLATLADRWGFSNHRAQAERFLGLISYEQNDLSGAAEHFETTLSLCHAANFSVWTHGVLGLALTYQAQGRPDAAAAVMRELDDVDWRSEGLTQLSVIQLFQAWLALQRGESESASRLLRGSAIASPTTTAVEIAPITRAFWLLGLEDRESLDEARQISSQLTRQADAWKHRRMQVQAAALRGLVLDAAGDEKSALDSVEWAVWQARQGGLVRTFVDLGTRMRDLLGRLAGGRNAPDAYLERIIDSFPESALPAAGMREPAASVPEHAAPMRQPAASMRDRAAAALDRAAAAREWSAAAREWAEAAREPTAADRTPTLVAREPAEAERAPVAIDQGLTWRELEVLDLLCRRLTNKEIAERLVLSPLTVKRHTINVYRKLQVNGRRAAVARAAALQLSVVGGNADSVGAAIGA